MVRDSRPSPDLRAFTDRLDLDDRLEPFQSLRWSSEMLHAPVLHLEDLSAIPFLSSIVWVEEYQHRARVQAQAGDLYATVTPVDPDYEAYCQNRLGLGEVQWFRAERGDDSLAVARSCTAGATFDRLADATRQSGGMVVHPYMSIEDVWELANQLASEAGVDVSVLGPPPPVTWIANDKALFTELVDFVLGPGWAPETHQAGDATRMAELLQDMARRYPTVDLKRTRCASATGNAVFDAKELREQTAAGVEATVRKFLERTEWPGFEPVLVVAWEEATSSPSTQWWVPPSAEDPPRLDDIYEQILEGRSGSCSSEVGPRRFLTPSTALWHARDIK